MNFMKLYFERKLTCNFKVTLKDIKMLGTGPPYTTFKV